MIKFTFIALIAFAVSACSTVSTETAQPKQVAAAFMHELFTADRCLIRDVAFKQKYFSKTLRGRIDASLAQYLTYKPPQNAPWELHPAFPDEYNKVLFMAWDLPSSYKIKAQHISGEVATVDVVYLWGPRTQYPGDTRVTSIILKKEHGTWLICDLQIHKGKFVQEASLYQCLLK